MFVPRPIAAIACLFALVGAVAGCGGSDSSDGDTAAPESRPAPPKSDFPAPEGRSLIELVNDADRAAVRVVSPAALVFDPGPNRYPFGVFNPDRTPINDAEVALYIAKVPSATVKGGGGEATDKGQKGAVARARAEALEAPAIGPFPAAIESMATKPAYRAQTTTADPDAAGVVYVSDLDFTSPGEWRIAALVREDDELAGTLLTSATVGKFSGVPNVGDRPPRIHTPTAADVGGDLAQITTRVPPDTQNRVDFANVVGKEPVVLLFATPQFCESRVCGPVVDVAEQAKDEHGGDVNFIHMEIFNDNDPSRDVRPQVRAFSLPSEPWLFAIDSDGVIRKRIEGAFGGRAMNEAVEAAAGR